MPETIKIKNEYFEKISIIMMTKAGPQRQFTPAFDSIIKGYFPGKTGHWIGRAVEKILSLSKVYFEAKQKLILAHASVYDEDVKVIDEKTGHETIKHKKGDLILNPNGEPVWKDAEAFEKEMNELLEAENDLGFNLIEFDPDYIDRRRGEMGKPGLTTEEHMLLNPLITIKEVGK